MRLDYVNNFILRMIYIYIHISLIDPEAILEILFSTEMSVEAAY